MSGGDEFEAAMRWRRLGNTPARIPRTVKERTLSSVASGVAVMAFNGTFWRNL